MNLFFPLLVVLSPFSTFGHPITAPQNAARPMPAQVMRGFDLRAWNHLPYSGGYLYAHAVRKGWIRPQSVPVQMQMQPDLACKHPRCAFKNQKASESASGPVDETPVAVNQMNFKQIITGGNDYNCSTLTGWWESTNGGRAWNRSCGTLINGGGDGDPVLGFDLNNNAFRGGIDAFNDGTSGVVVGKSSDGGITWSSPVQAVTQEFSGGGALTDKPWLQIDTNPSSPRVGSMYISVTQFDPSSNSDISVSHSTDGGNTWTTVSTGVFENYPVVNQFSDIAIGKDGTVYVDFIRCTANGSAGDCGNTDVPIMLIKSTDGGNTWSAPVQVEVVHFAPDTGCGFYGCVPNTNERLSNVPAIDIDNTNGPNAGALYVSAYNYQSGQCQVVVVKSTDGGNTWSAQKRVAPNETHDQFYPWLTVSATGIVGVTWMDRRNDPSNFSWEEYGGISGNGGGHYANIQIASQLSNPNNDGFSDGFIGDYTGNMWGGKKLYATWTDTSTGPPSSDYLGGVSNRH